MLAAGLADSSRRGSQFSGPQSITDQLCRADRRPSIVVRASLEPHTSPWAHPASTLIAGECGKALQPFRSSRPQWLVSRPASTPPDIRDARHRDPSFMRDSLLRTCPTASRIHGEQLFRIIAKQSTKHCGRPSTSQRTHVDPQASIGKARLWPCPDSERVGRDFLCQTSGMAHRPTRTVNLCARNIFRCVSDVVRVLRA